MGLIDYTLKEYEKEKEKEFLELIINNYDISEYTIKNNIIYLHPHKEMYISREKEDEYIYEN